MLVSILTHICLCQSFFNSNSNIFQKLVPEFQKKALSFFSYLVNERLLAMNHSEIRLLNQSTQNQVQLENQK